jgi:hypothetical protein
MKGPADARDGAAAAERLSTARPTIEAGHEDASTAAKRRSNPPDEAHVYILGKSLVRWDELPL